MKTRRALTSSSLNGGSRMPAADQIRHAGTVDGARMPLIDSESPHAVDDREDAGLLESISSERDADRGHEGSRACRGSASRRSRSGERSGRSARSRRASARPGPASPASPARNPAGHREPRRRRSRGSSRPPGLPSRTQQAQLPKKPVERLRPERVADHHVARAGRESRRPRAPRRSPSERVELPGRKLPGKQQPVVLVGADGLLAAALGAHEHQAAVLADRRRGDQLEQLARRGAG